MGRGARIAVTAVIAIPVLAIGIAAVMVLREAGLASKSYDFPEVIIRARVLTDTSYRVRCAVDVYEDAAHLLC